MFKILKNQQHIYMTRGDVADLKVTAHDENGGASSFKAGDVVRFSVFPPKAYDKPVIQKDVQVDAETQQITIPLVPGDTKFGGIIHEPVEYQYTIRLNPDTKPQTLIGYDDYGPKVFRLFPGGGEKHD